MGSTEPDRKRRHFSSISPTATAAATKKHPLLPTSEEKKLDTAVLQYKNQKLLQQLEVQKVEYGALESKLCQLKVKQQASDDTLTVVHRSWNKLVDELEPCSCAQSSQSSGRDVNHALKLEDGPSSFPEDNFLSRLLETGATERCSADNFLSEGEGNYQISIGKIRNILQNIIASIEDLWDLEDGTAERLRTLPDIDPGRKKTSNNQQAEVKNLRVAFRDLHLKHKSLTYELQNYRDTDAKNKAELKRLAEELEGTIAELSENNCKLAALKAQRDAAKSASFPVLNLGNNRVSGDKARDKHKDLQDMESELKGLMELSSSRILELKNLHEERVGLLKKLSNSQNTSKDLKHISSSKAYLLVRDQLEKSKAEVARFQALFEKLQVEKDSFFWHEAEVTVKVDVADVSRRASAVADSRIADLEKEIKKQIDERNLLETKLEEASKEPGRKEIIAEFKDLFSSFPENMGLMQSHMIKYKEDASDIYSLRAEVRSLSNILDWKVKELETLSAQYGDQKAEIQKLQAVVHDLKETEQELKLFLEMYGREFTDSRDVIEARDLEYQAWVHVQSLKSALDEHNLESRVKAANEAEAISQQRLATAEAEIAELRQKLEASRSDASKLSEVLKSKHEEGEAYLSEIESIGQAYDNTQRQNHHLLQQISERDDYNIKLVLEGLRSRQLQNALRLDKQTMEKELQQANASKDFYELKGARIEDQLHICSEQIGKLAEDRWRSSAALEGAQKRLLEVRKESQKLWESLEASQSKVERSRMGVTELQIELAKERFNNKRIEEELEVSRRKAACLKACTEGSSVLEKLQQEVREYREILKCSICHERSKEVVITKCYHLFCNTCIQKILETRQRKCAVCCTNFGPNDVKPVYI